MSTKTDYTATEWETLRDTPLFTALAMSFSSPNGLIGAAQEAAAIAKGIATAAQHPNPLISALNQRSEGGQDALKKYMNETVKKMPPKEATAFLQNNALMMCRAALAVLTKKGAPEEAEAYKTWILNQAQAVANAAKEGGQVISSEEALFMGEIGKALAGLAPESQADDAGDDDDAPPAPLPPVEPVGEVTSPATPA